MKIFCSLFGCGIFALLLTACNKKSDPQPTITKTQHLTASTWRVENIGADQNRDGVIEQSVLGFYPCLGDNTITFQTNNTGTVDEGSVKCNSSTPQTSAISWNFADAEANIVVANSPFNEINGKSKILELNATSLVLTKDTTYMGNTVPFVVRLKH